MDDITCPHSLAVETAETIGDAVVHFETIEGANHNWFGSQNDDSFMDLIISQL